MGLEKTWLVPKKPQTAYRYNFDDQNLKNGMSETSQPREFGSNST